MGTREKAGDWEPEVEFGDKTLDVHVFAADAPIVVQKIEAWELSPTMQW